MGRGLNSRLPGATRPLLLLVAAAGAFSGCAGDDPSAPVEGSDTTRIVRVIDGDTIEVEQPHGKETVRLIGIDTPETRRPGSAVECGGREATDNMVRLAFDDGEDSDGDGLLNRGVGAGRRVVVTADQTQATRDRYDRLLAYVQTDAGVDLGERQIRDGWAAVYVYGKPFARLAAYEAAAGQARQAKRGVWKACGGSFDAPA